MKQQVIGEAKTNTKEINNKNVETNKQAKQKQETKENKEEQKNTVTHSIDGVANNKKEETKEQNTKQENITTFKQNDTYIQKIKAYLKNNESDRMKKYGYNIIVDSSIVDQTTGFTYSEFNMSGYMSYISGTVKIYARDYIVNCEYVETRCYVL